MKKFKFVLAIVSLLASNSIFAVGAGWYDVGAVKRISSAHGGDLFQFSSETQYDVAGCQDNVHGYSVNANGQHSSRMFALLTTAYVTGKSVSIYLTGLCVSTRPEVNAIQFTEIGYH